MAESFNFQTAFEFVGEGELQKMIRLLDAAIAKQQQYGTAAKSAAKGSNTFTASTKKVNSAGQTVTTTMSQAASGARRYSTSVTDAAAATQAGASNMIVSWQSVRRIISGVVIARALGKVSSALTQAAQDAATLQLRIEEIRAIQGQATKSSNAWADALIRVSNNTGIDAIQVAESAYQALSNQVADASNVTELLEGSVIRLARVTATDLNTAVSGVSSILNSYSLGVESAEEVSAALFATVEQGRLRLGDIANSIGNVTIVSSQLGISFQEVLGSVAALTRQGTSAANAQTFLRNAMLALIKPSKAMSAALSQIGFESGEAATKQLGLLRTLELLSQVAGESNSELAQMAKFFNRIRGLLGATGLVGNLEQTRSIIDRVNNSLEDFRDRAKDVEKSTSVVLQKESTQIANSFAEMVIEIRNATAALNELPFFDLSDIIKITSRVIGFTLVAALISAATNVTVLKAAVKGLSIALGPVGVAFVIGVLIGEMANLVINSSKVGKSFDDLSSRIANAAKESEIAWAGANRSILAETERSSRGIVASVESVVSKLRNELSQLDEAVKDSFKATDRLLDLTTDPADKVRLLNEELGKLKPLLDKAFESKNLKEAGVILDRIRKDQEKLKKIGPVFDPSGRPTLVEVGGPSPSGQRFRRETFQGEFLNSKRLLKLRDEAILKAAQRIAQAKTLSVEEGRQREFTQRNLKTNEALLEVTKQLDAETKAEVQSVIKLNNELKRAQDATQGLAESFAAAGREGFGIVGGQTLLQAFGPSAGLFPSAEELTNFRAANKLLAEADTALTEIAVSSREAFADGILTPDEAAAINASATAILNAASQLEKFDIDLPKILTDSAGQLEGFSTQLEQIDIQKLNQLVDGFKNIQADIDEAGARLRGINFGLSDTITGTEQYRTAAAQATATIAVSVDQLRRNLEQLRQTALEVNRLNAANPGSPIGRAAGGFASARRFAGGGSLGGIGIDQLGARFAPGEFISNQASSAEFLPQLIAMNSGAFTQRRESGGNVTVGDINMTVEGGDTAEQTVRELGNNIRRELRRGTLRLN